MKRQIEVGTCFRYGIADANPEWEVIKRGGKGVWIARVCNSDPDYAGTERAFREQDIAASLGIAEIFNKLGKATDDFYGSLTLGQIVHYHNGFNSFVRCRVNDKKELVPIALVGKWNEVELPRRNRDGTIYRPYHAEHIMEGKPFTPNGSCIYECPQYARRADLIDPRSMVPISLDVSPMTPAQEKKAASWRKFDALRELVNNTPWNDPDLAFKAIKDFIE